jgi:membrane-associated protease RseP (regulator of RpoE activity)
MKLRLMSVLAVSFGLAQATLTFGQPPSDDKVSQPRRNPFARQDVRQLQSNPANPDSKVLYQRDGSWIVEYLGQQHLGAWSRESRTLGLTLAPADDALKIHLKLPKDQGLVVTGLNPNSSAHQAGIQLNDVLLKLGDTPLSKPEDIEKQVKSAGEKPAALLLLRLGKQITIQVLPELHVSFRPAPAKAPENPYWIGVSVTQLEPALRAQLQLPAAQGLIIDEVVKDSPASKTDIKVNDIILQVDGKPFSDSAKLSDIVRAHAEKPIEFQILREGKVRLSVEVTPERRKELASAILYDNVVGAVYGITQPGVVMNGQRDVVPLDGLGMFYYSDLTNDTMPVGSQQKPSEPKPSSNTNPELSKRLDSLDAQLKQLREIIDELSKSTKEKIRQ